MERRERALAMAQAAGAEVLLAADPETVAWLTGFADEIEWGASPFQLSPLAVIAAGEAPILVVSDDAAGAAAATGCEVRSYTGFTIEPIDPVAGARSALLDALGGRRAATEPGSLPAALAAVIDWVDLGSALAAAKAVKDEDEIALLRAAIALCDAGLAEARARAEPGMTELELWSLLRLAIESEAGARTPVAADCVAGPRTGQIGGLPGPRPIEDGDLVLVDLAPRRAGYWGDSCTTFAIGEPSAVAVEHHRRSRERLVRLVDAARPGAVAGDLDTLGREGLDYPHHTGHGLGTGFHQEPRIIPGNPRTLEAGMVVAFEPGSYDGTEGVRLEQVVLVTDDGCEILSGHELEL